MWRGERRLFNDLDVTVHSGRILHLRGANGFGKTTLLRILSGLLSPEEGSLTLDGKPFPSAHARAQATVGYLGHVDGLKLDLSAIENLRFAMRIGGLVGGTVSGTVGGTISSTTEHAVDGTVEHTNAKSETHLDPETLMTRVGLEGQIDVLTRHLSAGQRRRLALARLIGGGHRLWLLDEPFTTLDESGVNLLLALMGEAIADGIGIVLSSHQPVAVDEQHLDVLDLGRAAESAHSASSPAHRCGPREANNEAMKQ